MKIGFCEKKRLGSYNENCKIIFFKLTKADLERFEKKDKTSFKTFYNNGEKKIIKGKLKNSKISLLINSIIFRFDTNSKNEIIHGNRITPNNFEITYNDYSFIIL